MPISLPLTLISIFLSSPFFFFSPSLSDPRISEVEQICSGTGALSAIPNFGAVFRDVVLQVSNQSWGFSSVTNSPPIMYGLAQCHGDLDQNDCLLCYAQTRTKAPSCLPRMGRLYLDGCFLRFDNYSFFDETLDAAHDNFTCAPRAAGLTDAAQFRDRVGRVVANLTTSAVARNGFAVAKEEGGAVLAIYALAQCWGTVVRSGGCKACLDDAASKVKRCVPGGEGRAMNAGCFMRYSTQKFYNVPINDGSSHVGIIVAIALAAAASFSVVVIGVYVLYRRKSRQIQARKNPMRIPALLSNSSLAFKYELLEKATNFFDETRKLGQGGAGSVYKGILPDGKVVAVKRLVFNTRQWVDDFFNEVNLISGIQHKNLVKLLGCSIEGPESLLVYEYVPNRSLDQVLFVNNAVHVLSWSERLNVIVGTAEGLAYLHNDCGVKIIHRDIKTSNVLLDENLTAKIADFGLARCIAADNSHLSTGIAGTLGYMAPEYLVRGQLTEKADVYSFGVLVLEILCGRKNSVFAEGFGSVLQSVWKNYLSNCLHESVDIKLKGKFPEKEAAVVFQIGLLCTQASPELRPSMAQVVHLLKTKDDETAVPTPSQPPFLNAAALLSSDNSTRSSSTAISNQLSETSSSYTARSYGAPRKLFVPGVNEASENR